MMRNYFTSQSTTVIIFRDFEFQKSSFWGIITYF